MLSVSSQRKYNFYLQNTLLDAFRTNSRNIGRNPSMVIPLLANQDLTPMPIFGVLVLPMCIEVSLKIGFLKLIRILCIKTSNHVL